MPPTSRRTPRSDVPFSRPFDVDRLHAGEISDTEIAATDVEREALTAVLGLPRIDALNARLRLSRQAKFVRVVGSVKAAIGQICVVTLEPFSTQVDEAVDLRFAPQAEVDALEDAAARRSGDGFVDVADADFPDPIVDGRIDLGAVAAEALALGLDPYPRKPGAAFPETQFGVSSSPAEASPFAVLRQVKPPS